MRIGPALAAGLGLAFVATALACTTPPDAPAAPEPSRVPTGRSAEDLARLGEEKGIHNFAEVAPGLLRGAQPEGDASFGMLASLGVKTILSVDGARPDVEGAARHGIRYVHVPVEYSGIPRGEQAKIAKVAVEHEGSLFVHCHHGKHRGVAACAVAWMALDGTDPARAQEMMKAGGTDPKYQGLYGDVGAFRALTAEELSAVGPADLPSEARVPDLVGAMVAVDETFERMKAVKKAGWQTPASMPDVAPSHEARILAERFREAARLDEVKGRKADFRGWLSDAEKASWELEKAIEGGDGDAASKALDRVNTSCNSCHSAYRNRR